MLGHDGTDYRARTPQPIYAVCDGIVSSHGVSEWRPYGNFIDLVGQWYLFRYAHLSQMSVKSGQSVKEGDLLGMTGNTGKSGWPHLHFGCYKVDTWGYILDKYNGYFGAIDPEKVLKNNPTNPPITMAKFKEVLDKEFPEMANLFSNYSDTDTISAGEVKALIAIWIWKAKKQGIIK